MYFGKLLWLLTAVFLGSSSGLLAQNVSTYSLDDAIKLSTQISKQLKLHKAKRDEASALGSAKGDIYDF